MKQNTPKSITVEIIGWYGTIAIIGAYFLGSFDLISTTDTIYQILNLTGAIGIIVISTHKKVYQSVALNIIWSIIAVAALIQIFQ